MWMFLVNGFVCGLILTLTAVLLGMDWAQVITGVSLSHFYQKMALEEEWCLEDFGRAVKVRRF